MQLEIEYEAAADFNVKPVICLKEKFILNYIFCHVIVSSAFVGCLRPVTDHLRLLTGRVCLFDSFSRILTVAFVIQSKV